MPAEAVVETLRRVWNCLAELNVPMALMGGLSLAAWNRVRSTQDVDLLISLAGLRPQAVLAKLSSAGFRAKGRQAIVRLDEEAEFIQLLYQPPESFLEIQVDLLLANSEFQRQALEKKVVLSGTEIGFEVAVLRCEDLIILKLVAGRILDIVDAAELMRANRDSLDLEHLRKWARHYRLGALFRQAWAEGCPDIPSPL